MLFYILVLLNACLAGRQVNRYEAVRHSSECCVLICTILTTKYVILSSRRAPALAVHLHWPAGIYFSFTTNVYLSFSLAPKESLYPEGIPLEGEEGAQRADEGPKGKPKNSYTTLIIQQSL